MSELWQLVAESWEAASRGGNAARALDSILTLIRRKLPIQSIILYHFDESTKGAVGVACSTLGQFVADLKPIVCTESKWSELVSWIDEAEVLRQHSPKRSGKLAFLSPEFYSGDSIGIPLQRPMLGRRTIVGAVVLELEVGRTLRDEQHAFLVNLSGPFWLLLQQYARSTGLFEERTDSNNINVSSSKPKDTVVGAESGLKSVMERVELVSPSDMPVLILGDTGTGKEVVARAIHLRSSRASKPFIRVNCGAIPAELIDSQLFGHERGSFTGASDQRKGWFERADGGTLFLDEIGELPLAAQVRLLRVLQEHQIERVGGQDTIHVNVRIVAATHRDLATMVHQRSFREDLWYRINMFPILLPRLCERIEDIPALARHFVKKAASNFGLPYVELTSPEIKQLIEYRWPGNIRELQAVMDRAVILGRGLKLDIENALGIGITQRYEPAIETDEPTYYEVIPESSIRSLSAAASIESSTSLVSADDSSKFSPLDEAIRRHIEQALVLCQGQIEGKRGAAKLLDINPHTLRAKMRKLRIEWSHFRS